MPDYRALAERFARRLKETHGDRIERVVLFGSVARGQHVPDSDIDLLVVTPGNRLALQEELAREAVEVLMREGVVITPLVLTREEAERLPSTAFGAAVDAEGLVLA